MEINLQGSEAWSFLNDSRARILLGKRVRLSLRASAFRNRVFG